MKCYIWGIAVYGAATLTHQKLDHKYPRSFAVCFMRGMGKIIWTDHVKTEEVLHRAKNERNIMLQYNVGIFIGLVMSWIGTAF